MAWPSDLARTKNWGTEVLTDSDLEGQFDLIIAWLLAFTNQTTGHSHAGTSNTGPQLSPATALKIASQAQGDILYASTAAAWARLGAGTAGDILKSGGTAANPSWLTVLPVANGGTGATAAANAASGVVVLNASSQLPAVSGALLTALPALTSKIKITAYTGTTANQTVAHGLGTTPLFFYILPLADGSRNMLSWASGLPANKMRDMNTGGITTNFTQAPDATNIYLTGATNDSNVNGEFYVLILFA